MTRLNVYAGPAGFYLIRGGPDGDEAVLDSRFGTPAVLPGPAPKENDKFPPNKTYYEIPIAIQDRSFNTNGSLFYPDTRAFFDGISGPFIPESDVSPIWNPEFFGNTIMVNGNTWPFQTVERRRYRFRFLNGCQSRFLILDFSDIPGVEVWQIGNEGGFLAAPVNLTADHGNRLLMGPAERADLIVDFTNVPVGNHVLRNVGPDEPFGGGVPGVDFAVADPDGTGPDHAVPGRPGAGARSNDAAQVPAAAIDHAAAHSAVDSTAGAAGEDVGSSSTTRPSRRVLGTVAGDPNCCRRLDEAEKWVERSPRTRPSAPPRSGRSTTRPRTLIPCMSTRCSSKSSIGSRSSSTRTTRSPGRARIAHRIAPRAVGDRLQGHRHRLSRPGHPGADAVRHRPASSSGTATSSSTRTTR